MAALSKAGSVVALATILSGASLAASANGPELGKAAPPLNLSKVLQAPADATANWGAFRGKVVVLEFWATWCGPCRKSIPHWNELVDNFHSKPVQFLAITDENEQVVAAFLKQTPIHSWVGLDGVGKSVRDAYRIQGIPTAVIANQKGLVVAVTHPAQLEPKHIDEILQTGNSSLPPPVELYASGGPGADATERVPAIQPAFEVSVRRSGPVPPGHGFDCWQTSPTNADVIGQYASVRHAILALFNCKQPLLDCRTALPTEQYDFNVRLPPGASHADREQAVAPMFRSVFGLQIRREQTEREVYILTVASTNAPGLTPPGPGSRGGGGEERGGLRLGRAAIDWLPDNFERWLGKPVFNETGLTNRYDIRLKWKMSERELRDGGGGPDPDAIIVAVREQLGLGLSLQRRSVPVLIVEKSESSK